MKKLLLISLLILGLTGCSNDLAKLKTNDTITYNINNGFNAEEVLKDIKEGTTIDTKLDEENSKLIITLSNGDTTQTLEQAVNIEYPLATLGKETLDINAYNFDPKNILEDLKEGTDVKYELKDNEIIITLTNGEQVDTITRAANISHPLAWFNSTDITIDTYYGYDINELLTLAEGSTLVSDELNDNVLSVVVSNGEREEKIEQEVTLTSSVKKYKYVSADSCGTGEPGIYGTAIFYPDGTVYTDIGYNQFYSTYNTKTLEVGTIIRSNKYPDSYKTIKQINEDGSWFSTVNSQPCINGFINTSEYTLIQ